MDVPLHQLDAFADALFTGNPAAVMPLPAFPPDAVLQAVARENNLSETAFLVATDPHDGVPAYHLRWFTPALEVDLCGHATLASAGWLFDDVHPDVDRLAFATRSGWLLAERAPDSAVTLDFPAGELQPTTVEPRVLVAVGVAPTECYRATDLVLVVESAAQVRDLDPDVGVLRTLDVRGVVVTAPGPDGIDFVSRWFGAGAGIGEDPVTGSAHSQIAPYWARRLGRSTLRARQLSARGGSLVCEVTGDRVRLTGGYRRYLDGTAHLPD